MEERGLVSSVNLVPEKRTQAIFAPLKYLVCRRGPHNHFFSGCQHLFPREWGNWVCRWPELMPVSCHIAYMLHGVDRTPATQLISSRQPDGVSFGKTL